MDIQVPIARTIHSSPFADVTFRFKPSFERDINTYLGLFGPVQKFVDSKFMKDIQPYMPFQSGAMIAAMVANTIIGSGLNVTRAPQARYLYHGMLMVDSVTGSAWSPLYGRKVLTDIPLQFHGGGNAGSKWDERWATANLQSFTASVQDFIDSGGE